MSQHTELLARAEHLTGLLAARLESCCAAFPVDEHVRLATERDVYAYCEHTPARQADRLDDLRARFGPTRALEYNRLALTELVRERLADPLLAVLPEPLQALCSEWFARMLDDAVERPLEYYDCEHANALQVSDLAKDYAVAAGRAWPVGGAWIVERRRQLTRALFVARPEPSRSTSRLRNALRLGDVRRWLDERRGAYGDYYVIHTAYRYRRGFTARRMLEAYGNIALLLARDTGAAGIYRRSWFLDPEAARIDPRLAFLLAVPRDHGAVVRCCGPVSPAARPEIAAFSAARREALESGAYQPMEWAWFWPRAQVLRWRDGARPRP